jgi:hypothetical protein
LQLGTFSGIVVTLAGHVFRNQLLALTQSSGGHALSSSAASLPEAAAHVIQDDDDLMNQRPKVLPLLLLFAYVGAGTFHWMFEHLRRLELYVGLATVAGIIFLCVADVLVMWQPTRWAGLILQNRFLNASANWQVRHLRVRNRQEIHTCMHAYICIQVYIYMYICIYKYIYKKNGKTLVVVVLLVVCLDAIFFHLMCTCGMYF